MWGWICVNNLIGVPKSHLDAVRAVAFHPSEMCLASGGDDFTIKIWRLDPSALTSNS